MSKEMLEELIKHNLFLICDDRDSNCRFWLEVYRGPNIFLTEDEVNDYLISGKRKNKNRLLRYETGKQIIIKNKEMLKNFVRDSLLGINQDMFAVYGKIDNELAERIYEKSLGTLNVKGAYLELSANDLFHANKHEKPIEEGDIELTLEDMIFSFVNLRNGIVEKAIQRKNGENSITISFKKKGGRMILVELYSKSAGSLRFKTEWAISDEKYAQKYKSSSNSAGS